MTMTATYSPEDNKLRLYASSRLDADTFAKVKAAGFRWAPRQSLFVAPMWTPGREDLLLELCGEIGDEDTSLVDRAEERAERFGEYGENRQRDARAAEAAVDALGRQFEGGQPILVGHHSERRARRDRERMDVGMRRAIRAWETADYWQRRAKAARQHADFKAEPAVRARRIKGLEADLRKRGRTLKEAQQLADAWGRPGLTPEFASKLANHDYGLRIRLHDQGSDFVSAWQILRDGLLSLAEVAAHGVAAHTRTAKHQERWIQHLTFRLDYERALLVADGGLASDRVSPEVGGGVRCWASARGGWSYVQKVNRVSVTVLDNWGNGGRNFKRTIPFDKLGAVMPAAAVAAAKAEGRLTDTADGCGFFLHDAAPATEAAGTRRAAAAAAAPDASPRQAAKAMRERRAALPVVQPVHAPQLFPTPAPLARRMVELASLAPGQLVLEPSAGTGALLQAIHAAQPQARVLAVEVNPTLARHLQAQGHAVHVGDFLEYGASNAGCFDRIVMNPPFGKAADIKHIEHALQLLRPGGRVVALCANGPRQQSALRAIADHWEVLPTDTFRDAGTEVSSVLAMFLR